MNSIISNSSSNLIQHENGISNQAAVEKRPFSEINGGGFYTNESENPTISPKSDPQKLASLDLKKLFESIPWHDWFDEWDGWKKLPKLGARYRMYPSVFIRSSGRIKGVFIKMFIEMVRGMKLEKPKRDSIGRKFLASYLRGKLKSSILSPQRPSGSTPRQSSQRSSGPIPPQQKNMFEEGTDMVYSDWQAGIGSLFSRQRHKARLQFTAKFPVVFDTIGHIKSVYFEHAIDLIDQLPRYQQNYAKLLLKKNYWRKSWAKNKFNFHSTLQDAIENPESSAVAPDSNQPLDTNISILKDQQLTETGPFEVDMWRYRVPEYFCELSIQEIWFCLDNINHYVEQQYVSTPDLRNSPSSEMIVPVLEVILPVKLDVGSSNEELSYYHVLQELLQNISANSLFQELQNLGLSYEEDLVQMVLVCFLYKKLSEFQFFPDNHRCLDTLQIIQDAEPLKDLTMLRKNVILKELEKRRVDFNGVCNDTATRWAFEADAILSALTVTHHDNQIQLPLLTDLFKKLLCLHVRFEVESPSIQYEWSPPYQVDGPNSSKKIRYTRMFGVALTMHGGMKYSFLKPAMEIL